MPSELDQALQELEAEEQQAGGGLVDVFVEDTKKTVRAAGMMLGLYKPASRAEAAELRKRFAAEAALLGASAVTGGAAGAALKGVGPIARHLLRGALTGAAGTGAFAAVEGDNVPIAAGVGAVLGGGGGAIGAGLSSLRQSAARTAGQLVKESESLTRRQFRARGVAATFGEGNPPISEILTEIEPGQRVAVAIERSKAPVAMVNLRGLFQQAAELPVEERVRALQGLPSRRPGVGAAVEMQQFRPEDVPLRGPRTQHALDPFSVPVTPEEHLLDLRTAGVPEVGELPISRLERLARGTEVLPEGQKLTIATTHIIGPQGRDVRGRFTAKQVTKGIHAYTEGLGTKDDINQEAAKVARQAFIEMVGGEESGRIAPPGTKARLPRKSQRLGARPRRGVGTIEDSVAEFLRMGAAPEVTNLAMLNSVTRRTLMKLGDKIEVVWKRLTGKEAEIGERIVSVFDDVVSATRRGLVPVESALRKMGPAASELSARMSKSYDAAMRAAAGDIENMMPLKRLSAAERKNVAHVLHGDDVPMNAKTAEVAKIIRDLLDDVAGNARDTGLRVHTLSTGKSRPFRARDSYYPLEYSQRTINRYLAPGPEREQALAMLMRSQQSLSRREAEATLNRYLRPHLSEFRYGHLQLAREIALPGWEDDPMKVLPAYFMRARKRIEIAREFGPGDEHAMALIREMRRTGFDDKYAFDAYKAFVDKESRKLRDLAGLTRTINMLSLLNTTGVVQLAQHSNTIALTGYKNYLQGLALFFKREPHSREWAARTGAYMQELMQDLVPFGQQGVGSWWASTIRLTQQDRANRIIAALAGRYHADDIALKYARATAPRELAALERQLTRMRLNPAEVKAAGGILTPEQRTLAAQQVSLLTQFRGSVLDMPLAKHSTAGQFIYLFKNFAVQQSRFISTLASEARKGNWTPLIRYLSATGTLTYSVGATIMTLKYGAQVGDLEIPGLVGADRRPDREGLLKFIELTALAGSVGIAWDALRAMEDGPQMLTSFLLGPTANDVLGLASRDLPELAKGNPAQIVHDTLKHIPLFGRRVADHFVPLE